MPSDISETFAKMKAARAERENRMRIDPVYRAEEERKAAEADALVRARFAEEERRNMERARRARRLGADVPPRIWGLLDAPQETDALAAVRAFLASGATFLVLGGAVGCGKTVAACAALDEKGGRFMKAAGVTRARFNDEAWEALLDASCLVIDDMGTESLDEKGWAAGALAELFDHRYDWQSKTILTTNLDGEAFKTRYCSQDGGRFLSRLREAGQFVSIAQGSLRANNQPRGEP